MLCYERLLMDNTPPARRPHKSPAHTVKDRGDGLSAMPQTLQGLMPEGAAHHTADSKAVNTS